MWLATTDRKKLARSAKLVTSLKLGQVIELMSGTGELGVLADGSGTAVTLPEGLEVPADSGTHPLVPKPLPPLPMEDHPFMLDEYASGGVHADSYNSSVSPLPGPVGTRFVAHYVPVPVPDDGIAMCTPLMRDLEDRLASVCISLGGPSQLVLFDPTNDFAILAQTAIPQRRGMLDPSGGWYSRMDNLGRPVVPTPAQDIRVFEVKKDGGAYRWEIAEKWDLSKALPEDVSASDAIPDWRGNLWFISGFGHVGYVDRKTGGIQVMELGGGDETIGAALTVGKAGAWVLTSKAVYMLGATQAGRPTVRWEP